MADDHIEPTAFLLLREEVKVSLDVLLLPKCNKHVATERDATACEPWQHHKKYSALKSRTIARNAAMLVMKTASAMSSNA